MPPCEIRLVRRHNGRRRRRGNCAAPDNPACSNRRPRPMRREPRKRHDRNGRAGMLRPDSYLGMVCPRRHCKGWAYGAAPAGSGECERQALPDRRAKDRNPDGSKCRAARYVRSRPAEPIVETATTAALAKDTDRARRHCDPSPSISRIDQRSSASGRPSVNSADAAKCGHCRLPTNPNSTTVSGGRPSANAGTSSRGYGVKPPTTGQADRRGLHG